MQKSYTVITENTGRQEEEGIYHPASQRYVDYSYLFDVLIFIIVCDVVQRRCTFFVVLFSLSNRNILRCPLFLRMQYILFMDA